MKKFVVPALLSTLVIAGCSPSVPKCGDEETIDLVKEIADEEMANQLGAQMAKLFSYKVSAIRTTNVNEKTGAYECAAQLTVTASNTGQSSDLPITYTVELTDDKKEFYVTVYGL